MTEKNTIGRRLRTAGLLTAVIGLAIGILFAVTIGKSCGFLGSLVIVFCFLVSLAGGVIFASGLIVEKRSQKANSENQLNSSSG